MSNNHVIKIKHSGKYIPTIGLGTFGSDHVEPKEIARSVRFAINNAIAILIVLVYMEMKP